MIFSLILSVLFLSWFLYELLSLASIDKRPTLAFRAKDYTGSGDIKMVAFNRGRAAYYTESDPEEAFNKSKLNPSEKIYFNWGWEDAVMFEKELNGK